MDKKEREQQLINEVGNGINAEKLLNNAAFKEAVQDLNDKYIRSIRSGNWLKKRAREENCRRLQVINELVTILGNKVITGEQAQQRLEANNGTKQRRK